MRIGIIGMGGIGGFIGAHLAKNYELNSSNQVVFICRGESLTNIKNKGLTLKSSAGDFRINPALASDQSGEIGELDVLIITVKSYSLQEVIITYKQVIKPSTIIIPLLNGVNAKEMIEQVLPGHQEILEGCIYVVSNISEPGVIIHKGGPGKINIGGNDLKNYKHIIQVLSDGGLNISFDENIKSTLWRKFLFVSPVAAITTAYKITFGEILINENLKEKVTELMTEVKLLAKKSDVFLEKDVIIKSLEMLNNFPFDSKSSLQLDFEQGSRNEREIFIDFIVERSSEYDLPAHAYKTILKILRTF